MVYECDFKSPSNYLTFTLGFYGDFAVILLRFGNVVLHREQNTCCFSIEHGCIGDPQGIFKDGFHIFDNRPDHMEASASSSAIE